MAEPNVPSVKTLLETTVLVTHTVRGASFGGSRKDDRIAREAEERAGAEKGAFKGGKVLVDPRYTEKLRETGRFARDHNKLNTLLWGDDGRRLLPGPNLHPYLAAQAAYQDDMQAAARVFEGQYAEAQEDARRRLGDRFLASDFPAPEKLFARSEISGHYKRFSVGHPDRGIDIEPLQDGEAVRNHQFFKLHEGMVKDMERQVERRLQAAVTSAVREIWERLRKPVETLRTRLEQYESDEVRSIQSAWVKHVREAAEIIPRLNFTGDERLNDLCREIEIRLGSYDKDALRESKAARKMAREDAGNLVGKMDAVISSMDAYFGPVDDLAWLEEAA